MECIILFPLFVGLSLSRLLILYNSNHNGLDFSCEFFKWYVQSLIFFMALIPGCPENRSNTAWFHLFEYCSVPYFKPGELRYFVDSHS